MKACLLMSLGILFILVACDSQSAEETPNSNIKNLAYTGPVSEGVDDCPEGECAEPSPFTMCHFANNLGSLAVVELIEEINIVDGVHCSGDRPLREMKIKVWSTVAGETLPEEFTVYSEAGLNGFGNVGDYGLMQLHELDGRRYSIRVVPVDINSLEPLDENRSGKTRNLPTNFEDIVSEAEAVSSGTVDCSDSPRHNEDSWRFFRFGDCTDD